MFVVVVVVVVVGGVGVVVVVVVVDVVVVVVELNTGHTCSDQNVASSNPSGWSRHLWCITFCWTSACQSKHGDAKKKIETSDSRHRCIFGLATVMAELLTVGPHVNDEGEGSVAPVPLLSWLRPWHSTTHILTFYLTWNARTCQDMPGQGGWPKRCQKLNCKC